MTATESLEPAWWRRDLDFPHVWPAFLVLTVAVIPITLALVAVGGIYAGFAGQAAYGGALFTLWGPRGLMRPTAARVPAIGFGLTVMAVVWTASAAAHWFA